MDGVQHVWLVTRVTTRLRARERPTVYLKPIATSVLTPPRGGVSHAAPPEELLLQLQRRGPHLCSGGWERRPNGAQRQTPDFTKAPISRWSRKPTGWETL